MIDQTDLMEVIKKYRGDGVVIPVFQATGAWTKITDNPDRDIAGGGAMGKASSFALGLAVARPEIKVILLDGDGSLEMNLGSLVTIAERAPKNFFHFVIQNGVYATTGGQPIAGDTKVSFAGMAKDAGYAATYDFDDLEEFTTSAEKIFSEDGPVLICAQTVPVIRSPEQRAQQQAAARANPNRRTHAQALLELRDELRSTKATA